MKNERNKMGTSSLNSLVFTLVGGATTMAVCLFALRRSEAPVDNQNTDSNIWRTGFFLSTLAPASCIQAAPGKPAQLPAIELRVGDE